MRRVLGLAGRWPWHWRGEACGPGGAGCAIGRSAVVLACAKPSEYAARRRALAEKEGGDVRERRAGLGWRAARRQGRERQGR